MGSKTQIALPDLDDEQAEGAAPSPSPAKTKAETFSSTDSKPEKADVIPVFLPLNQPGEDAGERATATPHKEQAEAGDEEVSGLPTTTLASQNDNAAIFDAGSFNRSSVEDPELIELLEQLSATIDNANMMLSEAPPLRGPVADEYAAAGDGEPIMTSAHEAVEKSSRAGSLTALLLSGVFLCTAAGGYWWFKTNPWLLDVQTRHDTALSITEPRTPQQESVEVKLPDRSVGRSAPQEKADRASGAMVASLGPQIAPPTPPKEATARTTAGSGPVHAPAGSPVEIDLALPEKAGGQEVSIMVQGVPQGVTLSRGSFIGGGTWVLTEQEAANLVLNTPASFDPQTFAVDVVFVKSDGKVPESRKIEIVVDPVHAPAIPVTNGLAAGDAGKAPPAPTPANVAVHVPASGGSASEGFADKPEPEEKTAENTGFPTAPPSSLPKDQEARLLARGKEFMELGDVASARLIYAHAARLGSKDAMLALGKSFDAAHLASLGVRGVQPDKNQATAWYERASRQADR